MDNTWLIGLEHIWFGISIFLLIFFALCRFKPIRSALESRKVSRLNTVLFILIFSIIGIFGTCWNIHAGDGIANFRAVGVMLGGFIGGPVVGSVTGLIVGLFRAIFFPTETSFIHGGLTIIQGIAAGFMSYPLKKHHFQLWKWSLYYAFILEIFFWVFYAILTWPYAYNQFGDFLTLCLPVFLPNPFGVSVFYALMEAMRRRDDREGSALTQANFDVVNTLIESIQGGMTEENINKLLTVITRQLPALIWAALIYKGRVYVQTSYHSDSDRMQGEAETAVLTLQKKLAPAPHIRILPVMVKGEKVGEIYAAKAKGYQFTGRGEVLLKGVCRTLETMITYEHMKNEESLLQEAEVRALQAQINPHFLYNTLNTILYYVRSDPETARKLISALSDYFRHSLNNPSKLIPLSDEIHTIDCYMKLEKARFGDRLTIKYHFPKEDLDNLMIPPLLLQPLIENAVNHGILKKDEGGTITAGLIHHKGYNKFYVVDTGVGIPEHKLKTLLDDHQQRDQIGLINVNERLISMFGRKAGLHIHSREGKGTIVFANVPVVTKESLQKGEEHGKA